MISFYVPGLAMPQGSKTAFAINGRAVMREGRTKEKAAEFKRWRQAVADATAAAMHGRSRIAKPSAVRLVAVFAFPRPASHYGTGRNAAKLKPSAPVAYHGQKPDISKLLRAVEDSMTGIAYDDDSQIADAETLKIWCGRDETPGVYLWVSEITHLAGWTSNLREDMAALREQAAASSHYGPIG